MSIEKRDSLAEQSMDFSVSILALVRELRNAQEYIVSAQIGRSGTSIGANIREAQYAQSKSDFASKLQIALKEASETRYWLELLYRTQYIGRGRFHDLDAACASLISMLVASVKSAKQSV